MLNGFAQESISVSSRLVSQLPSKVCMYFVHCTLWQVLDNKIQSNFGRKTYIIPSLEGSDYLAQSLYTIPSPESLGYFTDFVFWHKASIFDYFTNFVFGHTAAIFGHKPHHTLCREFWSLDKRPLYHTLSGGFWLLYNTVPNPNNEKLRTTTGPKK